MTVNSVENRSNFASQIAFVLICLITIFSAIVFGSVDQFVLTIFIVLVGVMLLLWATDSWISGEIKYNKEILQLPIIGLLLLALIQLLPFGDPQITDAVISTKASHALSVDAYATRLFIFKLLGFIGFFAAALRFVDSRKRVAYLSVGLICFGALSAFFAILQALSGADAVYGIRPTPQAIFFGYFVNRHHFATLMIMCCGIALSMLVGSGIKSNKKMLIAVALVVMSLAIIYTGSRGGIISFICMAAYVVAAQRVKANDTDKPQNKARFAVVAGVAVFVLILGGMAFSLGIGDSMFRAIGLSANHDDPSNGRFGFWATSLRIFFANPIIGSGFGSYGTAYPIYDNENGLYRLENAHNDYLQVLAEGGLIGITLIGSFIFLLFKRHFSLLMVVTDKLRRDVAIGAFGGIIGLLIHSIFDFPLRTNSNVFVFLLLVILAVSGVALDQQKRSSHNN